MSLSPILSRLRSRHRRPLAPVGADPEAGMTTAEYAVGTLAAAALAGALYVILRSGTVVGALTSLVTRALSVT
jgi:hypothetical protein